MYGGTQRSALMDWDMYSFHSQCSYLLSDILRKIDSNGWIRADKWQAGGGSSILQPDQSETRPSTPSAWPPPVIILLYEFPLSLVDISRSLSRSLRTMTPRVIGSERVLSCSWSGEIRGRHMSTLWRPYSKELRIRGMTISIDKGDILYCLTVHTLTAQWVLAESYLTQDEAPSGRLLIQLTHIRTRSGGFVTLTILLNRQVLEIPVMTT